MYCAQFGLDDIFNEPSTSPLGAERASGQEWHFDSDARNKAGAWMSTTKMLIETGKALLESSEDKTENLQKVWHEQLQLLKQETGEA